MITSAFCADFLPVGAGDRALVDQLLRRSAPGVNEELMTAFHKVAGHRAPHDAKADETDLCHVYVSSVGEIMGSGYDV